MKWPNECVIETLKTGNDAVLVVLLTHLMTCVPISFFMTWKTKLQLFLTRLRGKYIDCTEKYYSWSLIIIGIPIIKDLLYKLSSFPHICICLSLYIYAFVQFSSVACPSITIFSNSSKSSMEEEGKSKSGIINSAWTFLSGQNRKEVVANFRKRAFTKQY